MEKVVGEMGRNLLPEIMQTLTEESQPAEEVVCPQCGGALHNKGKRPKRVITARGELEVKRNYYVCRDCEYGFFPPRRGVGVE